MAERKLIETVAASGPGWTFDSDAGWVVGNDRRAIAFIAASRMDAEDIAGSNGQASAIGRLIASAPALFEALESVCDYLRDPDIHFPPALHDQITDALFLALSKYGSSS